MTEPEFLSPAWLDQLRGRLASLVIGRADGVRLALGQVVTGVGTDSVSYTISFGAGEPTTVEDGTERAQVTLVEDRAAARQLAAGAPAGELLAQGAVKLRGDVNALLGATDALAELGAALASPPPN